MPGRFSLDDYEPVAARIARFYTDHPHGRIITELVVNEPPQYIVKANIYRPDLLLADGLTPVLWATGYAEEIAGNSNVNKTSALENCETSAIGRALANAGYSGTDWTKRASREEMAKVERGEQMPTWHAANKTRIEAVRAAMLEYPQDLIGPWYKAQDFPFPWSDESCNAIEEWMHDHPLSVPGGVRAPVEVDTGDGQSTESLPLPGAESKPKPVRRAGGKL